MDIDIRLPLSIGNVCYIVPHNHTLCPTFGLLETVHPICCINVALLRLFVFVVNNDLRFYALSWGGQ